MRSRFNQGVGLAAGQLAKSATTLESTSPAVSRKLEMRCLWSVRSVIAAVVVIACITPAPGQSQSINRTASGQPNTDIRVGAYINVRPDCAAVPLPSIQLASPPENGKVTVKKVTVT